MIMTSCNFNILYIIIFTLTKLNFNIVIECNQFYLKFFIHVIRDLLSNNNNSIANVYFALLRKSNKSEDGS